MFVQRLSVCMAWRTECANSQTIRFYNGEMSLQGHLDSFDGPSMFSCGVVPKRRPRGAASPEGLTPLHVVHHKMLGEAAGAKPYEHCISKSQAGIARGYAGKRKFGSPKRAVKGAQPTIANKRGNISRTFVLA